MKTGMKKRSYVAMMFLVSFIMLLLSKPAHAATFENKVYYDAAKNALQKAVSKSGLKMQMDADLNKLGLQLAVDMASGEGYDFEVGLPMREERLQKSTNYYKSWFYESAGFLTSSNGIAYAQEQITNSLTYLAERYSDYNLVGITIIENARTKQYKNYAYMIIIGKGTCKPETKTGIKTETIKSGAAVSFTGSSSSSPSSKVKVETVKISGTSNTLLAGKKMTLKAVVSPSNASDQRVTWSVSNKNYASVSSQGVVTAKSAGAGKTVTITAKAKDGSGKKAIYKIYIKGAVKKISLKASKSVTAGKSVTVKATVSVGKGGSKALTWSSSNEKYAAVTSKGVVTTKKEGKGKTVTITAKAADGSGKSASVKIKIK